nr:MAG TPA: hypothetical protein [Caudoviricetes sp.]DAQ39923.1 MAG TPA: hypothetical protein [Bacteriophage sp.]
MKIWKRIIGRSIIIDVWRHMCKPRIGIVCILCFFSRIKYIL